MTDWLLDWWDGRNLGAARSPKWSQVRAQHIALYPHCAVCGTRGALLQPNEVHHKVPVNVDKTKELSSGNLITLCRRDHLLIGHLNSFRSYNEDVEDDSAYLRSKIELRP